MVRAGSVLLLLGGLALGCGGESRRTIEGGSGPAAAKGVSYSTDFELSESPLSERGAWHHESAPWTSVATADGIAFGTQPLGGKRDDESYNDSYAYLSGFPPDQAAEGVLSLGEVDPACTHEVALLLRWSDGPDEARGYEANLAFDGSYAQIVRWNGALGDYDFLVTGSVPEGLHDGDTFSASIVGETLTLSVNGIERASARDGAVTAGNPGIAFWRGLRGCGTLGDFGFTSFEAHSLDE